jgi:hypothetical protein
MFTTLADGTAVLIESASKFREVTNEQMVTDIDKEIEAIDTAIDNNEKAKGAALEALTAEGSEYAET